MTTNRILVIDDERDLCEILMFNLSAAGFNTEVAYSAEEALERIFDEDSIGYDLLLLDVMMPGMSGFELAAQLKQNEHTARIPIIFLTAKDTESDTLHGFDLGADDYVTKPFSVREVMARVKAVLARIHSLDTPKNETQLTYEGLMVDVAQKTVTADDVPVNLTRTEFALLALLMQHRDEVLSRQQLLDGAWPPDVVVTDRTVDVNITRLRKKIGDYAANVISRQGYGYCFSTVKK